LQVGEAGDLEARALFFAEADFQDIGEFPVIFNEEDLQVGLRELFLVHFHNLFSAPGSFSGALPS
jgi:hypothetical protein